MRTFLVFRAVVDGDGWVGATKEYFPYCSYQQVINLLDVYLLQRVLFVESVHEYAFSF